MIGNYCESDRAKLLVCVHHSSPYRCWVLRLEANNHNFKLKCSVKKAALIINNQSKRPLFHFFVIYIETYHCHTHESRFVFAPVSHFIMAIIFTIVSHNFQQKTVFNSIQLYRRKQSVNRIMLYSTLSTWSEWILRDGFWLEAAIIWLRNIRLTTRWTSQEILTFNCQQYSTRFKFPIKSNSGPRVSFSISPTPN